MVKLNIGLPLGKIFDGNWSMVGGVLPSGKFPIAVGARNMIHYWQKRDVMIEVQTVAKIGETIKKVRKEQKVTQVQLAQLSK